MPGAGMVRLDTQNVLDAVQGFVQASLSRQGCRQIVMSVDEVRPEANGLAAEFFCLLGPAQLRQEVAQVAVVGWIIRLAAQGLFIMRQGLVQLPPQSQQVAQGALKGGVLGTKADGFSKRGQRFLGGLSSPIGDALREDAWARGSLGLIGLAVFLQGLAEMVMDHRIIGAKPHCVAEASNGLADLSAPLAYQTEVMIGRTIIRLETQGMTQAVFCFFELAQVELQ